MKCRQTVEKPSGAYSILALVLLWGSSQETVWKKVTVVVEEN